MKESYWLEIEFKVNKKDYEILDKYSSDFFDQTNLDKDGNSPLANELLNFIKNREVTKQRLEKINEILK